jgi:hypothetical protein
VLAFAFSDQRFHPVPAEAVAWCLPPHAGEAWLREFRVGGPLGLLIVPGITSPVQLQA